MSEVDHICLFFVNINNNNKESNTFFKVYSATSLKVIQHKIHPIGLVHDYIYT